MTMDGIALDDNKWAVKKLLDHGFIHLLDSMPRWDKPRKFGTGWGNLGPGDVRICQAARVSMGHLPTVLLEHLGLELPEDDRTPEMDEKLINYLMREHHTSPFEKVRFEFVCKIPIFIARQWIRHRMGSFNEISARYSKLPCEFYIPEPERMQRQSSSNKQASGELLDVPMRYWCQGVIDGASRHAYEKYESLLDRGLARELARMVLPTNFYTQWYWTTDLHNLFGFLERRLHPHAQYEIRVYAEAILEMIKHVAPVAVAAFERRLAAPLETEQRRIRAEGKLAALIEWGNKVKDAGGEITVDQLLNNIEAMLEGDSLAKRAHG